MDKGTCFRECSSQIGMGFRIQSKGKQQTARRTDLILEDKEKKYIWICDIACPQDINIVEKRNEKQTKYKQLAFE